VMARLQVRPTLEARQRAYNDGGRGVRLTITLSPVADAWLDKLYATGLYGRSKAGVAQEFIYHALREHMRPTKRKNT